MSTPAGEEIVTFIYAICLCSNKRDTAAFPVDTWVKQIMNDMYGFDLKDVKGMQAFAAEKYGDLAGYAQQYLFYYYRDRSRVQK